MERSAAKAYAPRKIPEMNQTPSIAEESPAVSLRFHDFHCEEGRVSCKHWERTGYTAHNLRDELNGPADGSNGTERVIEDRVGEDGHDDGLRRVEGREG